MRISIAVFALMIVFRSAAQNPQIRNLVFEGAGIRGIAYCGVIQEMENQGMMSYIQKVGGTSAGSIIALTLSLGYNSNEIASIISTTDFKKFNDGAFFFAGGFYRMNKYFGWYRGKQFEKWLGDIIRIKTGNPDITFRELKERKFKELHITGTCLNKQKLIVFNNNTYPDMRVLDAVRVSMSIPLYFAAVHLTEKGEVVSRPTKKRSNLDIMVDGGLTGNFPISMFDKFDSTKSATLGFRIDSDEQIVAGNRLAELPINNFKEYITAFYTMVLENLNRQQLTEQDWKRTVSISDGDIGPRIRKLSAREIELLINNGRTAMKNYMEQN